MNNEVTDPFGSSFALDDIHKMQATVWRIEADTRQARQDFESGQRELRITFRVGNQIVADEVERPREKTTSCI